MGIFSDNEEDDEIFTILMLMHMDKKRREGGGCLGCLLLIIGVPLAVGAGVLTLL